MRIFYPYDHCKRSWFSERLTIYINPFFSCSYFLRLEFSPHSATERCLASLDFLSGLIPGRPIIPYAMFTERGPVSLGGVISNWLWSVWNDPDPSDAFKEAMLHVLVVTNNAWLSGVADPWEWETHFDLIHWSANPASFPNRTIKAGLFQSQFIDSGNESLTEPTLSILVIYEPRRSITLPIPMTILSVG